MKKTAMPCGPNKVEARRRLGAGALALALAAVLTMLPAGTLQASGRPEIGSPVVLVYSMPFPAGVKATPANLPLSLPQANAIDIGPNRASYPQQYDPDPRLLEVWRGQNKLILRRGYVNRVSKLGARPEEITNSQELADRWAAALREPGIDGIAVDEFQRQNNPALNRVWIEALAATRRAFPHKYIFIWVAGRRLDPALCRALRDHADFAVVEVYLKSSQFDGKPQESLERLREALRDLTSKAPGIEKKVLMGLGIGKPWDDNPATDYPAFVADQIRMVGQDPELRRLPGIGFFAPHYADQATMRAVEEAIDSFLVRPLESWGGD